MAPSRLGYADFLSLRRPLPLERRRRLIALKGRLLRQALLPAALVVGLICGAKAAELPLARVVLSNSGLAQFTHAGTVAGGLQHRSRRAARPGRRHPQELDGVRRGGAVGAVSLPGKAPLAELFRDLPFGPDALNSPTALLNALVGSEVEIAGNVSAKGRIFRVESEEIALPNNGGTAQRHRLTLMTDNGLVQAVLEDVTALRFTDPADQGADRTRARRPGGEPREGAAPIVDRVSRHGTRKVAISYVVAAPVWKTAYRLVLPKDGGKARVAGLGGRGKSDRRRLEECRSGAGVGQSGRASPAALYRVFHRSARGGGDHGGAASCRARTMRSDEAGRLRKKARRRTSLAWPAPAPEREPAQPRRRPNAARRDAPASAPSDLIGAAADGRRGRGSLDPAALSLPRQALARHRAHDDGAVRRSRSAGDAHLAVPAGHAARRPLAAVRVRNDGDSGLPAGIVTAYDAAADGNINFVGDAQLPLLPKGAFKFVTFALDTKTDIRREDKGVVRTVLGKAVNGVLTLTTRSRRTITYEVTAPADEDREIVVEEPRDRRLEAVGRKARTSRRRRPGSATRSLPPRDRRPRRRSSLERIDSETVVLTTWAPRRFWRASAACRTKARRSRTRSRSSAPSSPTSTRRGRSGRNLKPNARRSATTRSASAAIFSRSGKGPISAANISTRSRNRRSAWRKSPAPTTRSKPRSPPSVWPPNSSPAAYFLEPDSLRQALTEAVLRRLVWSYRSAGASE